MLYVYRFCVTDRLGLLIKRQLSRKARHHT
jgi:hypothetical protein